jgi:protein involved in polysaccharide export with SLBB domain
MRDDLRSTVAALAVAALGAAAAFGTARADEPKPYRLGPEDHLMLKVWDLRNGDPYQWVALTGEFVVGADGTVSLPLVGELKAQGLSTAELATEIGGALQSKVGLSTKPDASVQVAKYRPFYVLGAVQRPGRYDFQPGLTVLQAVSTAQGMVRADGSDLATFQRQALEGRGDLRVLDAERNALLARQARLAAEVAGTPAVTYPQDLAQHASDPLVAQAMREENLLFAAERDALQTQITAIEQSKSVIRTEISSLAAKDASLNHQLDLTRRDLSQVTDLVAKGITAMPRQLAAEQTVASYESSKLDVQIASSKAQQDLTQADRDIVELKAKFRTGIVSEASDVRAKLDANAQRAQTARGLVRQAELAAPGLVGSGEDLHPTYAVIRASDGATVAANENDPVGPGDVVRVTLPLSRGLDAALPPGDARTASRDAK